MIDLWPAMMTAPARSFPTLAETEKPTLPLPLPESGALKRIQLTSVVAVQEHSLAVVTATLPSPPAVLTLWSGGLTV
jgi:hypothetical protein